MMCRKISLVLPMMLAIAAAEASGEAANQDWRPAFDKSVHGKTAWTQVNPWWPASKSRLIDLGGPNYAMKLYPQEPVAMWKEAIRECAKYGLTGWQFEMPVPGFHDQFQAALEAAKESGTGFKISFLMTIGAGNSAEMVALLDGFFSSLAAELKHPNLYRIDGHPVVFIYTPRCLNGKQWGEAIKAVEAKHGRMIWLFNAYAEGNTSADYVREFLPYFDGVSTYANWGEETGRNFYAMLAPIMHNEFPQKVFDAAVHNTYCVHFHYGGVSPKLSEKYRNSWDVALAARPDAVVMTNFFDTYENSLVLPCYEREDLLMRYAQDRLARWRGVPAPVSDKPELYLTNYVDTLLGQPLDFEILAFPNQNPTRKILAKVELCDTAGRTLMSFPEREIAMDAVRVESFSVPSLQFASQCAVVPRISYKWDGAELKSAFNPPTMLCTSLRPNLLFWARSTANALITNDRPEWTLNNVPPGGTLPYPSDGIGVFTGHAASIGGGMKNIGGGHVRIMRNGRELYSFANWTMEVTAAFLIPDPQNALDYYQMELENGNGCRFQTLPVWVAATRRTGMVKLPVWDGSSGKISQVTVEAMRVPFFYYPCDKDTGNLLLDKSGYLHNGRLDNNEHLYFTDYRHQHNGRVAPDRPPSAPSFANDPDGKGFLRFNGKNQSAMIMGGTAFPYAATFEVEVRPAAPFKKGGILGTANGQINLELADDGRINVTRSTEKESEGGGKPANGGEGVNLLSKNPLKAGEWHRVAVTYDLKTLSLYVDGKLQDAKPSAPKRGHEWINHLTVGSLCNWVSSPAGFFQGDLREIRIYGRNLAPNEFLKGR